MKLLHMLLNNLQSVLLSIAIINNCLFWQLDVKKAFLHGFLKETVFVEQPPGFTNPTFPNHVCHLKRAFYRLKQAPRAWLDRFSVYLGLGFFCSKSDSSLFLLCFARDFVNSDLCLRHYLLEALTHKHLSSIVLEMNFLWFTLVIYVVFLGIEVIHSKCCLF